MAIPPVTDAQANAITAVANFGQTVVEEGSNLARYVGRIVGTVPEDAVAFLIGDPLRAIRTVAAAWYDGVISKKMKDRGIEHPEPVSLSLAIPLVRGAYDESREGLRDLWANLIAAAMDPQRASRVRLSFIETLKRLDPIDALVLHTRRRYSGGLTPDAVSFLASQLGVSDREIELSVDNLLELKCVLV